MNGCVIQIMDEHAKLNKKNVNDTDKIENKQ